VIKLEERVTEIVDSNFDGFFEKGSLERFNTNEI